MEVPLKHPEDRLKHPEDRFKDPEDRFRAFFGRQKTEIGQH
ncbi:hypothetical protein FLJC2902T_30160 [Flavobacterium limnosediminis JC2902]|uniref:Uncharacterized protein n=1 Tax=Flavobacterium limnosediminis JC2902 TaxID=1341181 RepID=V6SH99_9FLAO|nr:hypothetical protein FLJC2902T_30160 [Flavobacterium limnosediminis JC2902]